MTQTGEVSWNGPERTAGPTIAVVMIALNEAHDMEEVLDNLSGWADEVFLVDSLSTDATVDIALRRGVHVVQRRFRGFGDQWNFALRELPIRSDWTMKLDPDERISVALKRSLREVVARQGVAGVRVQLSLWFMGQPLPIRQMMLRAWRTGACRFSDVAVNEHPVVDGTVVDVVGELEHHDSPTLFHWFEKQNRYSTAEALSQFEGRRSGLPAKLFGSSLERRMWLREVFWSVPGRFALMYCYHLVFLGAWRAGRVGRIWSRLRTEHFRNWEYKLTEMQLRGRPLAPPPRTPGPADPRVRSYE